MFKNKTESKRNSETSSQNRIGKGTELEGDVVSNGGFRIDGVLKGTLKTKGKVVIGKEGKIVGSLFCSNADIQGSFEGSMKVEDLLSLKSTAVINGEIVTGKLMVEPGTEFNGTCTMKQDVKLLPNSSKSLKKSGKTA
ncbi:MAG: polymer-forming cytoskeletal protein [Nonlabens sp.]